MVTDIDFEIATLLQYDPPHTWRGGNLALIQSREPEVILAGPAECLAGETLIHDFLSGNDYTIQDLCEKKIAPMVLTLFGIKSAEVPFLKGKDDLYRVSLDSGHSFLATKNHIVLTSDGWKRVSGLSGEHLLGYEPIPLGSNSERVQRVPLRDALNLSKSPFSHYTVFSSTVSNVEYVRTDNYYDMTVPDAGHYVANGIIHHNTGKTYAACYKAHWNCREYPGAQGALVRKVAAAIPGTVLATMKRIIGNFPVNYFGGDKNPERIIYPNGSQIWIGGMDNPTKVLSGERDFIQVCQAEELQINDWEVMTTRSTGRGAVMPYTQVFGDCNPSGSKHFLRTRPQIRMILSHHRDNPTLYDDAGNLTEQGKRSLSALEGLTGVRRKRLLEGIWATAEGVVYDTFDTAVHVKVREDSEMVAWYLAMDEGYTNPAVILLIGVDTDGRWHIAREWYERGQLESAVVAKAKEWYLENHVRLPQLMKAPRV